MANTKIFDLTASGAIADGDVLPIVDVSDTTDSADGSTRKITKANLTTDLAPKASPTFTGTVTIPTPFTLGAVSVTATGTELNYVAGVTSAIQTQINTKAATDQTMYIGTTAVAINRASAALTLAGLTLTTPDIGTPSAGVLTNCTGLPVAGIVASTVTALGVGSLEVGHASDTTLSRSAAGTLAVEGIRVRTTTPLIVSAASYTTDTGTSLNMDNLDIFVITAQAGALLFNAPGGTLVQGRSLIIRIKDNATARALTWNAVFRAMGTALPSTTVLSKTLYLGFFYNSTDTKWDLVASAQEA